MKKLVWAPVVLLLVSIFAFSWAPLAIRSYVHKHYPGIIVQGDVTLRWGYVFFTRVEVDRPNINGTLDRVIVDWDKNVQVYGGTLTVTLSEDLKKGGDVREGSLRGEGLTVEVTKGSAKANLKDVSFDAAKVCFKSGTGTYHAHAATLTDGCYNRTDKVFTVKHVEAPIEIPFEIPRVEKKQVVKIEGARATFSPLSFKFDAASIDPFFKVKATSSIDPSITLVLNDLEVNHPWVSPDPVTFKRIELSMPTNGGSIQVKSGDAAITLNPATFHAGGTEACNTWVEAMPEPAPIAIKELRGHFTGNLGFNVQRDPAPQLNIDNRCKYDCSAEPIANIINVVRRLNVSGFTYLAYDKNDKLFERTVGPTQKDWVNIETLPPHIPKAFITLEDPGFLGHRGIIPQALENSLKDNLKLGKFFRGGSTISMQLAKNLWLKRHKTVGRKAQEALLTIALESCLSKDEILELYMNVVEFGPNLYGIGPASEAYFQKPPEDLEPVEAFYLASILPRPRKAIPPASGGLARVSRLMTTLASRGFISETLIPVREDEVDSTGWETE